MYMCWFDELTAAIVFVGILSAFLLTHCGLCFTAAAGERKQRVMGSMLADASDVSPSEILAAFVSMFHIHFDFCNLFVHPHIVKGPHFTFGLGSTQWN